MRKAKLVYSTLIILLLSAVLAGQVGSHLMHHHEGSRNSKTNVAGNGEEMLSSAEEACALCKLDLFPIQEFAIAALLFFAAMFVVVYIFAKQITICTSVFFKQSRGPPAIS